MRNLNKTDLTLAGYIKRYISLNLIFTVVGCLLFCACPNWFKCGNSASSHDSDNQTLEQAEQKIDEANKEIDEAKEEIAQAKTEEEKRKAEDKKEIAKIKKKIAIHGKIIAEKKQEMAQAKTEKEKAKVAAAAARAASNKACALIEKLVRELHRYSDSKIDPALTASKKVELLFSVAAPQMMTDNIGKALKVLKDAIGQAYRTCHIAQDHAFVAEKAVKGEGNNQAAAEEAIQQFNIARSKLHEVEKIVHSQELKNLFSIVNQEATSVCTLAEQAEKVCHDTIKNASEPVQKLFEKLKQLYADWQKASEAFLKASNDFQKVKWPIGLEDPKDPNRVKACEDFKNKATVAEEAFEKEKKALQALLEKP